MNSETPPGSIEKRYADGEHLQQNPHWYGEQCEAQEFDLLLMLDVFEHVRDPFHFPRACAVTRCSFRVSHSARSERPVPLREANR